MPCVKGRVMSREELEHILFDLKPYGNEITRKNAVLFSNKPEPPEALRGHKDVVLFKVEGRKWFLIEEFDSNYIAGTAWMERIKDSTLTHPRRPRLFCFGKLPTRPDLIGRIEKDSIRSIESAIQTGQEMMSFGTTPFKALILTISEVMEEYRNELLRVAKKASPRNTPNRSPRSTKGTGQSRQRERKEDWLQGI
jgi:hypothetical protein